MAFGGNPRDSAAASAAAWPRILAFLREQCLQRDSRRHACECPTWYPTYVKKTSVYLSQDDVEQLERLSRLERVSNAEVIRRAIRSYEPQTLGDRNFSMAAVACGPGDSMAELDVEALLKGFGDDAHPRRRRARRGR